MRASAQSVAGLRDKYVEIKRLRDAAAAGQPNAPRAVLAALARRFPGALRELDQLPMEDIERRLNALQVLVREGGDVPQWVALQVGYHAWMRLALRIRRCAIAHVGEGRAHAILRELSVSYRPAPDEPELWRLDHATIESILKPHGGRLNPWVFSRVAQLHAVEPSAVERALFREQRAG